MASPVSDSYSTATGGSIYGGRSGLPAWIPATAWQWTDVPGTNWDTYLKTDGTGIAPIVTAADPGPSRNYATTWIYSGPAYSRKNHEFWMFGGGHAGTTINIVTKYNLHKDSPDVSVVCAATTEAMRDEYCNVDNYASYYNVNAYWPDGKPYSPHSYTNNIYVDSTDEFVSFGHTATAGSADGGNSMSGPAAGLTGSIPALSRSAGNWQAPGSYSSFPAAVTDYQGDRGARAVSADGSMIYYLVSNTNSPRYGLNKYTISTKVHAHIGGTVAVFDGQRCSEEHDGVILVMDAEMASGWRGYLTNVTTGAKTDVTFTHSGTAINASAYLFDLVWIAALGYYVAVWVYPTAGINGPGPDNSMSSIVLARVEMTSANTANTSPIAITGTAPNRLSAYRGAAYDPLYGCLLLALDYASPIKAIKVA